jgi:ABC-type dipeptide/oligopeptide/nickel transport system permease component
VGVLLGAISAVRHNTWIDRVAMFTSVFGVSTPSYVFITVLIVVLAIQLHLVPTGGWGGIFDTRIFIPAIALAVAPAALIARYTRASVLEVLHMDYVRTARAKGLRGRAVLGRHSLPNALIPVVTVAGIALADLITGSFFVEAIYQVPGIGRYFVTTVQDKDYPVLMAVTLLYAAIIWFTNFIVDILYCVLDPRVRLT